MFAGAGLEPDVLQLQNVTEVCLTHRMHRKTAALTATFQAFQLSIVAQLLKTEDMREFAHKGHIAQKPARFLWLGAGIIVLAVRVELSLIDARGTNDAPYPYDAAGFGIAMID